MNMNSEERVDAEIKVHDSNNFLIFQRQLKSTEL